MPPRTAAPTMIEKPAETEATDPPSEKSATIDDVKRIVGEAVDGIKELFSTKSQPEVEDEPAAKATPAKRKTYRDEEDSMEELVSAKVQELFAKEKATGSKNDPETAAATTEKAPPEPIPGRPEGRRVESFFGWNK
jgi:hypothetical protein